VSKNPKGIPRQYVEFYMLIGQCIKHWAGIEDRLFDLCTLALNAEPKQAAIVYYRTPSLDARLTLVDELIVSILPKKERKDGGHDHPLVTRWKALVNDIRDLLPVRNMIAHAPISELRHYDFAADASTPTVQMVRWWIEISPSPNERLRERESTKPSVKDTDLPAHLEQVNAIWTRLEKFLRDAHGIPR
jgi:hypothetical protein